MAGIIDKLLWTPAGASGALTLADLSAGDVLKVEQIGGKSLLDNVPLAFAANPALLPRGNVSGAFVCSVGTSHDTRQDAVSYFASQYALLNGQGTLVWIVDAATLTMTLATVADITASQIEGTRWGIRYTFTITALSCAISGE
jgi:hypothetical protein